MRLTHNAKLRNPLLVLKFSALTLSILNQKPVERYDAFHHSIHQCPAAACSDGFRARSPLRLLGCQQSVWRV